MVIGKGLIACGFDHFKDDDSVCIFASGVSNSGKSLQKEYLREREMILKEKDFNGRFIYFGTTGVYDPSRQNSDYILHKLEMERIIEQNFSEWTIIRLPNVVGKGGNPKTMINYFKTCIRERAKISILKQATRHILDIEDIGKLVTISIDHGLFKGEKVNFCPSKQFKVLDIVRCMEDIMSADAKLELIEGGSSYNVPNSKFENLTKEHGYDFGAPYLKHVLMKYLS